MTLARETVCYGLDLWRALSALPLLPVVPADGLGSYYLTILYLLCTYSQQLEAGSFRTKRFGLPRGGQEGREKTSMIGKWGGQGWGEGRNRKLSFPSSLYWQNG